MAIIKEKTVRGYQANYWRIVQAATNLDRDDVTISMALYKDRATRRADPEAIMDAVGFVLHYGDYTQIISVAGMIRDINLQACYNALMISAAVEAAKGEQGDPALAWFADAVNDEEE